MSLEAAGALGSAASLVGYRDGETVCLWDAESQLFGRILDAWTQTIGCCVMEGCGRAMQDSIYNAIAFGDQIGVPVSVAPEPTYGLARMARDIGNGRMGNNPNGNYQSWFARAFHEYGVAIRKAYGTIDLTRQREDLAARWCVHGGSTPQQIIDESKNYPAAACYWPETIPEVLGVLRSGRGIARSGAWATNERRQSNGYTGLRKSGGHCECWRGVIVDQKGDTFVLEQNSWGNDVIRGQYQIVAKDGRSITLPPGSGLIDLDDVATVLKRGEVTAFEAPKNLWRDVA
jgi:hypothetical protein